MAEYENFLSDFKTDKEKQGMSFYDMLFFLRKDCYTDGVPNGMTDEQLKEGALELFGIENFEADERMNIRAGNTTDDSLFYRVGHGMYSPFYDILDYTKNGESHIFTIRTYADISEFVVSDEVVITINNSYGMYNYSFDNIELVYSSGIKSGGMRT